MNDSSKTTDHRQIKSWADTRGGIPTRIKKTSKANRDGYLHIYFPEANEDNTCFQPITWQTFFDIFKSAQLEFVYQDGMDSTFHEFVDRK